MAEFRDVFRIDVEANDAIRKVKEVTVQLDTIRTAILRMGNTPNIANIRKLLKPLIKDGKISKNVLEQVITNLKRVAGAGTAKNTGIRVKAILDINIEEAERKISELQQQVSVSNVGVNRGDQARALVNKGVSAIESESSLTKKLVMQRRILKIIDKQIDSITKEARKEGDFTKKTRDTLNVLKQQSQRIAQSISLQQQRSIDKSTPSGKNQAKLQAEIARVRDNTEKATSAFDKYSVSAQNAAISADKIRVGQDKLNKTLTNAAVKIIKYRVAFIAMRAAIDGLKASIKTFSDLQLAVARLQKVVNPITADMAKFRQEAFNLGRQFGATAEEVLKSFKIFAQTGLEQEEVLAATRAALIGMNAVGLDAQQITDALTAVIFTYNIAVEESTTIISKWIAVQAKFPVNASDLANALKVIGAAAKVVGVDIDDLAGSVTAIAAITRKSGTAIGQSLKTIFARLPKKETVAAFESVGIAVRKSATEFRDFDDILKDLSKQWPRLDDVTKTNIATTLGGIRRYADFIALMDNFQTKINATAVSQRASNEAITASNLELATFQKTVESALVVVQEFGNIVGKFLAAPLFLASKALLGLRNILGDQVFKGLGIVVAGFVALAVAISVAVLITKGFAFIWAQVPKILALSTKSASGTTAAMAALAGSTTAAATAATGFIAVSRGVLAALGPWAIGIAVVLTALSLFSGENKRVIKSNEELSDSFLEQAKSLAKVAKSRNTDADSIERSLNRINELRKVIEDSTKSDKRKNEALVESENILRQLPRLYSDLTEAASKLRLTNLSNAEASREFNKASEESIKNLREQAKASEELARFNLSRAEAKLTVLQVDQQSLKSAKSTIVAALSDIEIDLFSDLRTIADETIPIGTAQTISGTFIKRVKKFLADDAFGFKPDENGIIQATKKPFENISEALVSVLVAGMGVKLGQELTSAVIQQVDNLKTKTIDSFSGLSETLSLKGIDSKVINQTVASLDDEVKSAFQSFVNLASLLEDSPKDDLAITKALGFVEKALADLDSPAALALAAFESLAAGANAITTDKIVKQRKAIDDLRASIEGVDSSGLDGIFLSGGFSKEIIAFRTSLKSLKTDFENLDVGIARAKELQQNFDKLNVIAKKGEFGKNFVKQSQDIGDEIDKRNAQLNNFNKRILTIAKGKNFSKLFDLDKDSFIAAVGDFAKDIDVTTVDLFIREAKEDTGLRSALKIGKDDEVVTARALLTLVKNFKDEISKGVDIQVALNRLTKDGLRLYTKRLLQQRTITILSKREEINSQQKLKTLSAELEIFKQRSKFIIDAVGNANALADIERRSALERFRLQERIANIAKAAGDEGRSDKIRLAAINKLYKEQVKIIDTQLKTKIEAAMKPILEGAAALRDGLTDGIGSIPDLISTGAEKRADIELDIKEIQLDISEARQQGDKRAIFDAEQRLKKAREELNIYKRGLFEVGEVLNKIFGTITSKFWKKITDDFVDALLNISIGGKTLAEQFGSVFAANTVTLDEKLRTLNQDYLTSLQELEVAFLKEFNQILIGKEPGGETEEVNVGQKSINLDVFNNPLKELDNALSNHAALRASAEAVLAAAMKDNTKTTEKEGEKEDKRNKKLADSQKLLQSGLLLVASTVTQSLFAGSKSASTGAGLGNVIGNAVGARVIGGILGGPLGALAGGLIGGGIGSLFGGDKKKAAPRFNEALDKNTDAIIGNTLALKNLDAAIFNAPTGFNVPGGRGGGTFGREVNITIQATGASANEIAGEVANIINGNFDNDILAFGSRASIAI